MHLRVDLSCFMYMDKTGSLFITILIANYLSEGSQ